MVAVRRNTALEVHGSYLLGIVGTVDNETIHRLRTTYQLMDIEADRWYPADDVIGFYQALQAQPAGMFDLVEIGKAIVEKLEYPPEVETMADALAIAEQMHMAAWRGGDPGNMRMQILGERHISFRFERSLLPSDLVYGICYGLIQRFNPDARNIVVMQMQHRDTLIYELHW
jgi:hypothetical protein